MNARSLQWLAVGLVAGLLCIIGLSAAPRDAWSAEEIATLQSLSLSSLPPLPPDPSNAVVDDPRAAELGHRLFFDTRLSGNGEVACASCHLPELAFTDGRPLAQGVGTTDRKSMTIIGTAYSPWLFWDGRADSQWSQALGPLENPVEHGGDRTMHALVIARHYAAEYQAIFGALPDLSHLPPSAGPVADETASEAWQEMTPEDQEAVTRIFVDIGKAIAAYERRILPGTSRFDRFVEALVRGDTDVAAQHLDSEEIAGLRLYIGKAGCTDCHNGPLFTNNDFHNTGVPARPNLPADGGRALGARQVLEDPFNCLGPHSDADPEDCPELRFLKSDGHELERAFKPPTLRNVAAAAPYMHAGQFATLEDVLHHYNAAPTAPSGHSELEPLGLSRAELEQLEAFLRSLSAPLAAPERFLVPPEERARSF